MPARAARAGSRGRLSRSACRRRPPRPADAGRRRRRRQRGRQRRAARPRSTSDLAVLPCTLRALERRLERHRRRAAPQAPRRGQHAVGSSAARAQRLGSRRLPAGSPRMGVQHRPAAAWSRPLPAPSHSASSSASAGSPAGVAAQHLGEGRLEGLLLVDGLLVEQAAVAGRRARSAGAGRSRGWWRCWPGRRRAGRRAAAGARRSSMSQQSSSGAPGARSGDRRPGRAAPRSLRRMRSTSSAVAFSVKVTTRICSSGTSRVSSRSTTRCSSR